MATGGLDLVLVPALGYDMVRATMITSRWRLQRAPPTEYRAYTPVSPARRSARAGQGLLRPLPVQGQRGGKRR